MALHRRAAKRDANEAEVVEALRAVGATVLRLSGDGVPDLLCGFRGRTYLLGVKRPDGPRGGTSHGRDRQSGDQRPADWPGGPWFVVTTVAEALGALGLPFAPAESLNGMARRIDAALARRTNAAPARVSDAGAADDAHRRGRWKPDASSAGAEEGPTR